MHGHPARTRLPEITFRAAQPGKFLPGFAAVGGFENGRVLHTSVSRIRIGKRRFEMPDTLEFPRMLRSVIPLVRASLALIHEFIAFALGHAVRALQFITAAARRAPGPATVIRTLNDLPKPTARLRSINAVRINGRALEMIHLPTGEVRPADFPLLALAIGGQDERTFLRANQYSNLAHILICIWGFYAWHDLPVSKFDVKFIHLEQNMHEGLPF